MSEQSNLTAGPAWCDAEVVARRPSRLFGLRAMVGLTELHRFPERTLPVVRQAAKRAGVRAVGPATSLIRPEGGQLEVTMALPVTGRAQPSLPFVVVKLSGGLVAQVVHRGSWDTLLGAYDRLSEWLTVRRVTTVPLMWEEYLIGPDHIDDPRSWRTRIVVPLPIRTPVRAGRPTARPDQAVAVRL
jgi:effector-binding domain-containing protein